MTIRRPCLAGLLALLPSIAPALDLRASLLQAHYDAAEKASGGFVLNRETGSLHGTGLRVAGDAGGRFGVEWTQLRGGIGYVGRTQFGLPLETRTDLRWRQATLFAAPVTGFEWAGLEIRPRFELSATQIDRAIEPTTLSSALTEVMRQRNWGIGASVSRQFGAITASTALRVDRPWWQRLRVDSFGLYDRYELEPSAHTSAAWGLEAVYRDARGWCAGLEAWRERRRSGESDAVLVTRSGVPAAASFYPGNTLWSTRIAVVMGIAIP